MSEINISKERKNKICIELAEHLSAEDKESILREIEYLVRRYENHLAWLKMQKRK